MEDPAQARAYSEADFASAHDAVVADLLARHPGVERVDGLEAVDLGCGPADVTVRLALALPHATVVGVDAGPVMLGLGRRRVAAAGLDHRVVLVEGRLPDVAPLRGRRFDLVASNSLLHHVADPADVWTAVRGLGRPGGAVHVADLRRPTDTEARDALVDRYAAGEPRVLVEDFRHSLSAAYRPDEVEQQLDDAGLAGHLAVEVVSDRHLVVHGRLPE